MRSITGVDVGVVPHIEDTSGAGARGDCKNCKALKDWIEMAGCNSQPNKRGKHRKQHDAWLHQCHEVGYARCDTRLCG